LLSATRKQTVKEQLRAQTSLGVHTEAGRSVYHRRIAPTSWADTNSAVREKHRQRP
jgi:hypothetical protein